MVCTHRYDCVTLADFMESIKNANQLQRSPSLWLLSDAANDMFAACAQRLRRIVRVRNPAQVPDGCVHAPDVNGWSWGGSAAAPATCQRFAGVLADPSKTVYLRLLLEPNPKWKLLSDILREITAALQSPAASQLGRRDDGGACVLVVAEDERTCRQLKTWLTCGSQVLLERLFDRCVGGPWQCCKWLRSQT